MRNKSIGVLVASLVATCGLTACSQGGSLALDYDDAANTVTATAESCPGPTSSMGGTLTVADGEMVMIVPSLEEGEMRIQLVIDNLDADADAADVASVGKNGVVVEATVSGKAASTHEVEPGEYSVIASIADGKKADGTVTLSTIDEEEWASNNKLGGSKSAVMDAVKEGVEAVHGELAEGETEDGSIKEAAEEVASTITKKAEKLGEKAEKLTEGADAE